MPVTPTPGDDLPLEAAADWFLLLAEDDTPENRRRWQRWHDAHPSHQWAWEKVEKLQSLLAAAPPRTRQVLGEAEGASRRQVLAMLGLVGMAVAGGVGYRLASTWSPGATTAPPIAWIVAAPGARRAVDLPDGGQLWLAAGTRVGIAYDAGNRDIYMTQGALQMTSGQDPEGRPLRILARDGIIRPLGTRLSVSLFGDHTVLAVQQHAAEAQPLSGSRVRVEAGQRVIFSKTGSGRPEKTLFAEDAWTGGLLTALNMPLTEFAERFALYTGQHIEVAPALALRRVSGTFRIDAADRSLHTLADGLALRLEKTGAGWRLRAR
jgi:transmembrane sensor